ncbi:MAG TPA: GntR family transcriptional regulator [Candidatus Limiplasma sp.]|nr:GntR family transcriptional regulator [Candidatus Limiplasma sp.]HPS80331.1 GntR family transcriptional regulator [Candidatus Limiplasma sp.]
MEKYKYLQLTETLRAAIQSGQYGFGAKLPSENELTRLYACSRQTVRQALGILDAEGLTERVRGSGTFVKGTKVQHAWMHNVAVVSTYISDYILPSMLAGIQQELSANGYTAMFFATNNRVDNERRILNELMRKPIDGLLVEGTKSALPNPNLDLYRKLRSQGIPVVFLNGFYQDLGDFPHVVTDDCQGGYIATNFLIGKGHRKIAGIFKNDDRQGHERYLGYSSALIEHGLDLIDDNVLWFTTHTRADMVNQYALRTVEGCTAVVCYNDEVAVPLLNLLLHAGKAVPQDMAIISFDHSTMADLAAVRITSLDHPKQRLGVEAVRMLLHMINGQPQASLVMPWGFAEQEST